MAINKIMSENGLPKSKKPISARGAVMSGIVVSTKAKKTAVVQVDYTRKVSKYGRLEKRRSKIHVHVPDGIEVKEGDTVDFSECRKISKTKSHVVTKVLQ